MNHTIPPPTRHASFLIARARSPIKPFTDLPHLFSLNSQTPIHFEPLRPTLFAQNPSLGYAPKLCQTPRGFLGPTTQMVHRSHPPSIARRWRSSRGLFLERYYTVRHGPYAPTSLPTLSFRSIVLGIAIVVFLQCMITLLDPVGRVGKDIKWGSVAHTAAMFLVLTMSTVLGLEMKSMAYVNNRDFHGGDETLPGPLGYYDRILSFKAISAAFSIALPLNQWLADGLLVRASNTFSKQIIPRLMRIVLSAVSLLRHLFDELLGHGIPMPDVSCLHWYASIFVSR